MGKRTGKGGRHRLGLKGGLVEWGGVRQVITMGEEGEEDTRGWVGDVNSQSRGADWTACCMLAASIWEPNRLG